ncbi:MAG: insulinase family protein [Acidobacteria bacterium]|nr:insulinase family protein [Acidobacteriota bacterium]
MRYPILFAAVAACLCLAQDKPQILDIKTSKLPNGLELVLSEDHSRPVVNLQVWYHVGSKDERAGRTGFAHLFEHMMFRGSRNLGPEEHFRLVNRAGGNVNAYTTFDQTVYWETIPPNYLEQMMWAESDRMSSLVINKEILDKEREVVKEERRMRYDNPPYGLLMERLLDNFYQVYPYKHMPIGSMDDLNKASAADVQQFFDTFYVPNNATVVVVGDFDSKQAAAWAAKYFGPIPRSKNPVPRVTVKEPAQAALRSLDAALPNAPIPAVAKTYHIPGAGDPDLYALEIASTILSSGQSSRLYRKLVYQDQTAVAAEGGTMNFEGPSMFYLFGIVNQAKGDAKAVEKGLQDAVNELNAEGVSAEELEKAKSQTLRTLILKSQTMQGRGDSIGYGAVILNDPRRVNSELEKYQKVTAADVLRVAKKYLAQSNETRMIFTGEKK